ncbi:hypothetical protein OAJ99_00535 [Candidatus Poseidoniales archaeon]|nr:hypothetical protein [Candidatus Poseidoniales archaeon]
MPRLSKIGRVNQTGRRKLLQRDFHIGVDWSVSPPKIDQSAFRFNPPDKVSADNRVIIEAYRKDKYVQFDLGNVGSWSLPSDISLEEFGRDTIHFEVRVIDPGNPGILSWKSAKITATPPKLIERPSSKDSRFLLNVVHSKLAKGVPMNVGFPEGETQDPVKLEINLEECSILADALIEPNPQPHAMLIPTVLHIIVQRLVIDANAKTFEPEQEIHSASQWQNMWNGLFKSWTGKGLEDVDYDDASELSEYISEIIAYWATLSGNPAKSVSRLLGGD